MSWIKQFLEDGYFDVFIDEVSGLIEIYVTGNLRGKGNEDMSWYVSQTRTKIAYSLHGDSDLTAELIGKIRDGN